MRPQIIIPAIALVISSAGLALTFQAPATETLAVRAISTQKDQAAMAPEELAKKSGCFECHSIDKDVVGPAYKNVAERYKDKPEARAALIETVKKGGKGNWTAISHEVPMFSHGRRLSAGDIARLVDWVLGFNNNDVSK